MSNNNSLSNLLDNGAGGAQHNQGVTVGAFVAALLASLVSFGVQVAFFVLINAHLVRIYQPKTYLVPEKERASVPQSGHLVKGPWQLLQTTLRLSNAQFIQKCGLDAYFFLRFLRTLLKIFVPLLIVILPVLMPINAVGGRGAHFATGAYNTSTYTDVSGLDIFAWGNIRPAKNDRYWAHFMSALVVIIWTCYVFFDELKGYVRLRQAYLTSPQHRLRASATTVLVTAIPQKWCSRDALEGLYDVYPGGIRNIWVNRNFDELSEKVNYRNKIASNLEQAETALIRKAAAIAMKRRSEKATKEEKVKAKEDKQVFWKTLNQRGLATALSGGISSGDIHQMSHQFDDISRTTSDDSSRNKTTKNGLDKTYQVGESIQYPKAFEHGLEDDPGKPQWREYIKESDRETMRLPITSWMFAIPFVGKKVDKIYWCRQELARMNLEIEWDQQHPERYPLMNSAFIQFNAQVAAHMACQSLSHHTPKQMSQRVVEISPDDVVWDNMSSRWWGTYLRTAAVYITIAVLVLGWAVPVTFTGTLSHVSTLATVKGLHWINQVPHTILAIVQGILPPLLLSLLLFLVPKILRLLAKSQGDLTGVAIEQDVQRYYFGFLFVQVFLIVSISSGLTTIVSELVSKPQSVTSLLAENLPKASNYFFSYLLLQALVTSGGALLQLWPLIQWFLLSPLLDGTARQKWRRQIHLPDLDWGSFFPVYTNLACIGLIYSVIAPLILIFNVISFGLFWMVYKYNTMYVTKFNTDSGGLYFPTAINQLFTGLYTMEICLIGLFFLVKDARIVDGLAQAEGTPCKIQAILMIVVLILTIMYQMLLNNAFRPLLKYLPITLEDEAAMRDEQYAKAEERRRMVGSKGPFAGSEEIEMNAIGDGTTEANPAPNTTTSWAQKAREKAQQRLPSKLPLQSIRGSRPRVRADPESQPGEHATEETVAKALFAGISDEIEDLTSEDRDQLVDRAFHHAAFRARRPAIWIPQDEFGISDDEIKRTAAFSKYIWISNVAAGLDASSKVRFEKSPPDFSELDLISL